MIEHIIFDFGDVLINLDKPGLKKSLLEIGISQEHPKLQELNETFEVGGISEQDFLKGLQELSNSASIPEVRSAWNTILGDFPPERLEFLQELKKTHKLYLLSNTDSIHIQHFEHRHGKDFTKAFYGCFEKVYFSFEHKMRKPNPEIYQKVLNDHHMSPKGTLFVDDKKDNILAAEAYGIHTWLLKPETENVTQLFKLKHFNS
jgi:glucose-1-phosphatase